MVDEARPERPVVPHRVPLTRRQIFAQIIVSLVILGSGIAIGTGGTIFALKDRIARFPLPPPGGRFDPPDSNRPIERWRRELDLTDEQAQKIGDLFKTAMTAARDRWMTMTKEEQERQQEFANSMKSILTSEQYAKWLEEMKQRAEHFQRRWPGGQDRPQDGRGGPGGRRDRGQRGMRGPGFGPDHPAGFDPNGPHGPKPDGLGEPGMDHPPEPRPDGPPEPVPVNEG
jgi:Spy/CpxP family protein refolding chaperone